MYGSVSADVLDMGIYAMEFVPFATRELLLSLGFPDGVLYGSPSLDLARVASPDAAPTTEFERVAKGMGRTRSGLALAELFGNELAMLLKEK